LTRTRTRHAVTPPSSTTAVMRSISTSGLMPFSVADARATASPTASSIEFVDVPVSSIVFSTMVRVLPPGSGVGLEHRAEARYTRGMDGATVGVGFGVGLAMGVLATWLVVGLRARERAGEAREVRARLEAELEGERRLASERVTMLEAGEERLREAFDALSRRALDVNNRSFLELARVQLGQFQPGARSDLEARQTAIDQLLRPVRESLQRMDASLRQVETGHGALRERVDVLHRSEQQLASETAALALALRTPGVRGRWGEVQLRRVVE